ncbi:MAG TPA: ABC transporter substrate-binding protein [Dehalococcoidales bacterium]|nr:ABC transporter substrate-binding protein [Dehalococcoidales bacterium]
MKKLVVILAIILVIAMAFTACAQATPTPTPTPTPTTPAVTPTQPVTTPATPATPAIKKGGTLRFIYQFSPASIPGWPGDTTNPQKLWTCWIVFEALVKLDSAGKPNPWLATDWKWGPNNTYIDLNLRQDVRFHDGTRFTANSVVAHVNQLFTDKDSATVNWDRIEKTGDFSVRLYLKTYMRDFWNNLAAWSMFFTSDTQLKEKGLEAVKKNPIGTGPFKFSSFEKDVSLKFVRNPDYWQVGLPHLDAIEFFTTKEELTQQAKMEANEGDVLVLKTGKILRDLGRIGLTVITMTGSSNFIMFDTKNEGAATNNPKVRQAIEHAINKQEIADTLGFGGMKPNNQIPFTGNPAFNPRVGTREYNPEKAKQLLREAGYPAGLNLTMISEVAGQDFAIMFQQYLAAVGITLKLEMVDNAKLWNYLFTGWTGMISTGYAMGTNFPNFLRTYFPPVGTFNVSVKLPDDIVAKANAAMVEVNDAKFQQMSDELIQWVWDTAFFVPTVGVAMGYIMRPEIKDHDLLTKFVDFTVWSPERAWLNR